MILGVSEPKHTFSYAHGGGGHLERLQEVLFIFANYLYIDIRLCICYVKLHSKERIQYGMLYNNYIILLITEIILTLSILLLIINEVFNEL